MASGISGINYSYSHPTIPTTSEEQIDQQFQDPSLTNTQNQSNQAPIQHQAINWNQPLIIDSTNVFCNEAGECGRIVEVAFEINNTIVLESYNSYRIFKVADMINNLSGLQIIDVSTTPQDKVLSISSYCQNNKNIRMDRILYSPFKANQ